MAFRVEDERQDVVVAPARLWLNAARDALVADGHEDAAFLFCAAGQEIGRAEAERYGLCAAAEEPPEAEPEAAEEEPVQAAEEEKPKRRGKGSK